MSQQEIEKLEKQLQSYKGSLKFAIETRNKIRESKYKNSIRQTENAIKEIEKKFPAETKARLYKIDIDLKAEINNLEAEKERLIAEFDKPLKTIDRLLNPEKYKPKELDLEPIVEPEPIIETEQDPIPISEPLQPIEGGKIPCPDCGKLVKNEIGLRAHQSRWCAKKTTEVKIHE